MPPEAKSVTPTVFYRRLNVEGLEIFYREAGPRDAPTVLLLHGFPSSSHMFRNLIPMLADKYHVVAPDFPGYGESSAPSVDDFDYSFERLASVTEKFTEKLNLYPYALYLSDIGASVGFRLAVMHPERVTALIIQNGEAHAEALNKEFLTGLFDYWKERSEKNAQVLLDWLLTIEGTKWHYLHGASDPSKISPDNWVIDQAYQDRPGNKDIQLSILYNAKRNLDVYDDWQEYFRKHQPPTLITWGKNDGIFTVEGAELFKRDIPSAELHLFDTGHFALEEKVDQIGSLVQEFLDRTINEATTAATHAGLAAQGASVEQVHMHLRHTVNCLVGPKGPGFDAKEANPCQTLGDGAIPDAPDQASKSKLTAALEKAQAGLKFDDLAAARKAATEAQAALK